jgi:hypothetical protein
MPCGGSNWENQLQTQWGLSLRQSSCTVYWLAVDEPIAGGIICGAGEIVGAKIKHIVDGESDARGNERVI